MTTNNRVGIYIYMYIDWTPKQVEWPRPIRSLKRLKHAVHDERLGTFLMTRIKIVFNSHNSGITCIQLTF